MRVQIILLLFILSSCSYLPEPLNNPYVSSFGKKCNEETWSYIWIHKQGQNLTATEEQCKIPIRRNNGNT